MGVIRSLPGLMPSDQELSGRSFSDAHNVLTSALSSPTAAATASTTSTAAEVSSTGSPSDSSTYYPSDPSSDVTWANTSITQISEPHHGVSNRTLAIALSVSLGAALIIAILAFFLIRRRRQRRASTLPTTAPFPTIREKWGLLARPSTSSSSGSSTRGSRNINRLVISAPTNLQYFEGCGTSPLHAQLRAQCDTPTYPSPMAPTFAADQQPAATLQRTPVLAAERTTPLLPDAPPPPYIQEPPPELPQLPPNLSRMSYPVITIAPPAPSPRQPAHFLRASVSSMFSFLHKNPISPVPPAIPQLQPNLGRWSYQVQFEAEQKSQPEMQQLPHGEYLNPTPSEYGPSPDLRLSTLASFPQPPTTRAGDTESPIPAPLQIKKTSTPTHKPKSKSFARPFTPPLATLITRTANFLNSQPKPAPTVAPPAAPAAAMPSSPAQSYQSSSPTFSLNKPSPQPQTHSSPIWDLATNSPYIPSPGPSFLESPIDPEGWVGGGIGKSAAYGFGGQGVVLPQQQASNPYRRTGNGHESVVGLALPSPNIGVARGSGAGFAQSYGHFLGGSGAPYGAAQQYSQPGGRGLAYSKSVRSFTSTLYSDTASLHEVQGIEAVRRTPGPGGATPMVGAGARMIGGGRTQQGNKVVGLGVLGMGFSRSEFSGSGSVAGRSPYVGGGVESPRMGGGRSRAEID